MASHPRPRRALAVNLGKLARSVSRRLGKGGGTSLPGLLAVRADRGLVSSLSSELPAGAILVTGTNGKTTTCRIIAEGYRQDGGDPIHNREESNLMEGIATALLLRCDLLGHLTVTTQSLGVLEVDEGVLPQALTEIGPKVVLFTNLFRDQLDRYFEVDYVATLWRRALKTLPRDTVVILNADDPHVAYLGADVPNPVIYYGLEDTRQAQPSLQHAADARRCPRCSAELQCGVSFYAHLGHYYCPGCGWRRPRPQVAAWRVETVGVDDQEVHIGTASGELSLLIRLPGLYNVYNAVAAVAALRALGVDHRSIREAVAQVRSPFGRWELVPIVGRQVCLALAKNPSGFNEILRAVFSDGQPRSLLLALNDNVPDGRDVSWIWDIDLDGITASARSVKTAGLRGLELALRLKYSGLQPEKVSSERDVVSALEQAVSQTEPGGSLYAVLTYTAMWELREELVRRGYVRPFWNY